MPLYVMICVTVLNAVGRLPAVLELFVYVVLGVAWILPFKFVFQGIGQPDPDAEKPDGKQD
jgi:hypothetical protein